MTGWHDGLSVGNETLDGHHKELFSLFDQLGKAVEEGSGHLAIGDVLEKLRRYIDYHFAEEESWMASRNYQFLDDHRTSHQVICSRIEEIGDRFHDSRDPAIAGELSNFLTGWLVHHIEIDDFAYT